jgi:hypothetical protein
MKLRRIAIQFFSIVMVVVLSGCSVVSAFSPTSTSTPSPIPTQTATPTQTPTPTEIPFYVDATVLPGDINIPIVIYHKFVPDYMNTDATQMRLSDFQSELQAFYDNGFSLISFKDWLEGNISVPAGRKPMILTVDDLWFGCQLFIGDDGTPSKQSGLGLLYYFNQEHPDFGFHAALFAIYGDKYYPEKQVGDEFYAADNVDFYSKSWHIKLGNTIAWAMQNGLEVYNHTFTHPDKWEKGGVALTNTEIQAELKDNDNWERTFLTESGHEDLIPQLMNIIALPEGLWPESDSAKNVILNYKNPEGLPVQAVLEAYNMDAATLTPSVFSGKLDPYHIARITASEYMTTYIVNNKDAVPTAAICQLGPLDESQADNLEVLQAAIQTAVASQSCAEGVYNINGNVFIAKDGSVSLYRTNAIVTEGELTPTSTP